MAIDATALYRVQWQATLLQKRHVPLLQKHGQSGTNCQVDAKLYGSKVATVLAHALAGHLRARGSHAQSTRISRPDQRMYERAVAHRAEREMRPVLPMSNNDRQSHGHKPLYLQTLCLNEQPELAANISISISATVNPHRDVQGTGSYHLSISPANLGLAGTLLLAPSWATCQWTG